MEIKKVGVVGMGTMGSQIGIVCARSGFQTTLMDLSEELIKRGLSAIKSFLRLYPAFPNLYLHSEPVCIGCQVFS
jgi:3-hydroxyacyl-CoA dehydrogenase